MASNQSLLFFVVGKNEPLYEAEIHKRGTTGKSDASVARQSYFVVHSSLDLVDKATWTSQNVRTNRDSIRRYENAMYWILQSSKPDNEIDGYSSAIS
jgi:hypothetical protein